MPNNAFLLYIKTNFASASAAIQLINQGSGFDNKNFVNEIGL